MTRLAETLPRVSNSQHQVMGSLTFYLFLFCFCFYFTFPTEVLKPKLFLCSACAAYIAGILVGIVSFAGVSIKV